MLSRLFYVFLLWDWILQVQHVSTRTCSDTNIEFRRGEAVIFSASVFMRDLHSGYWRVNRWSESTFLYCSRNSLEDGTQEIRLDFADAAFSETNLPSSFTYIHSLSQFNIHSPLQFNVLARKTGVSYEPLVLSIVFRCFRFAVLEEVRINIGITFENFERTPVTYLPVLSKLTHHNSASTNNWASAFFSSWYLKLKLKLNFGLRDSHPHNDKIAFFFLLVSIDSIQISLHDVRIPPDRPTKREIIQCNINICGISLLFSLFKVSTRRQK